MAEAHSAEEVSKHIRTYMFVFVTLLFLTGVTVAASYLHLTTMGTIILALVIASIKGSLVAGHFMHLLNEKSVIYWSLAITVTLFLVCMLVPVFTVVDTISK